MFLKIAYTILTIIILSLPVNGNEFSFDVTKYEDEIKIEPNVVLYAKYLFWKFGNQPFFINIYPAYKLDQENDKPTIFLIKFKWKF